MPNELVVRLLDSIIDSLDIPESYYRRAADRHRSLGEWLCRPESKVAEYSPHVTPQGSFRYGTVIRPLNAAGEYDLDNVVTLTLLKTAMTQKQLKTLFGAEIQAYADAHQMLSPIEEMNRCWRLHYADEVTFHLDTLPCVAEEESVIAAIMGLGVPRELAKRAVAITDKRHPYYALISPNLLSSNPRGFARWFEERTRIYALPRLRRLVESRLYSSVEDVPAYEWKTPLQRSIQMLKRHRDVMFEENPELAPISMILTNLATHAYNGEPDIFTAVTGIVERMPSFIRAGWPRVPNPSRSRRRLRRQMEQGSTARAEFLGLAHTGEGRFGPPARSSSRRPACCERAADVPPQSDRGAVAAIPAGASLRAQRLLRRAGDRHHQRAEALGESMNARIRDAQMGCRGATTEVS